MAIRALRASGLVAGDAVVLALFRPRFAELLRHLRAPGVWQATVGTDNALASLAEAVLWVCAAWLGAGIVAVVAAELPGAIGRGAARVGRLILPRAVRRLVAGSLGLSVLLAPVSALAAPSPTPAGPHRTSAVPAPVWPHDISASHAGATDTLPSSAHPTTTAPAPAWPSSETAPGNDVPLPPRSPAARPSPPGGSVAQQRPRSQPAPSRPGVPTPSADRVRVRVGDSLWLIAARRLGPTVTAAQTAAAWPRWYAANREVIGAEPDLIFPGQLLTAPAAATNNEESG